MSVTGVDPIVEMQVDGSWVDITADCRQGTADSGGGFEISRGVPNEGSFAEPTQFNFTLNNGESKVYPGESGIYSPMNPMGRWFGLLGRNQRVRIGLDRRIDSTWGRTLTGSWGAMPTRTHADGTTTVVQEAWHLYGNRSRFSVGSNKGTIVGDSTLKAALFTRQYRDVDIKMRFRVSGTLDSEIGFFTRMSTFNLPWPSGVGTNNATGWTSSGGTVTTDSVVVHNDQPSSILLTLTSTPATVSIVANLTLANLIPLPNGPNSASYRAGVWLRSSNAANCRVGVTWYAEDGTTLLGGATTVDTNLSAANTWTWVQADITPPQDAAYVRFLAGYSTGYAGSVGWKLWMSEPEFHDLSGAKWYAATLNVGTNQLKLSKFMGATSRAQTWTPPALSVAAGSDYWLRAQMSGNRVRVKAWKESDGEPIEWDTRFYDHWPVSEPTIGRTGEVGILSNGGSTTLTVDRVQIDQWRAHTEIAKLPARFDLSRRDFWVPVQSRGILRRLNQGRKALQSPLSLHLEEYIGLSGGWWPLESDEGQSAGNRVEGGQSGAVTALSFSEPDTAGVAALPGTAGVASLDQDTSAFNVSVLNHTAGGKESFLFFARIPALPASTITLATIYSTGTVRTWRLDVNSAGAFTVTGTDRGGVVLANSIVSGWNGNTDLPTGCWIAFNLYIFESGGTVSWAWNHNRPQSSIFFTINGTYSGTTGIFTGLKVQSNSAVTAMGGIQLTQVLHYAGDLPFVDADFHGAASAYDQEEAAVRWLRLGKNADVPATTTGFSLASVPLGIQTASKLTELWEELAEADGGFVVEERDDFELTFVTRNSLWNRDPRILHLDQGHLTSPLEPDTDDQQTRNDVTISRPNGSFRRAIQESGPMNINSPETDPDGVGTYDEQRSVNVGTDDLCGSHANWAVSRGTQTAPRYPSFTCNMRSSAFLADVVLAADVASTDIGDSIMLYNTETDYVPRPQGVQAYVETISDIYDDRIVYTASPNDVRSAGVVNSTTRIGSDYLTTAASFTVGTDTTLQVTGTNGSKVVSLPAVTDDRHWPFNVDVEGVRLQVNMTGLILNTNSDFQSGTTGWVASSANVTIAPDLYAPRSGRYCLRVTAIAAGTDGVNQNTGFGAAATAGQDYLISGWMKTELASTDCRIAVDWYTGANAYISTTLPTAATTSANVWQFFQAVVTAPAATASARVRGRNVFASAYRAYFDNIRIMAVADYNGSTQKLHVVQTPINAEFGVTGKVIPSGSKIKITDTCRIGWGESS